MAGNMSNYLENSVLNYWLGKSFTSTAPATVYVALWASTLNDSFDATSTGECAGSTYARIAVTNSSNNFTNATAGAKTNKTTIEFTTAAGSDWGTVNAVAVLDSNSTSSGNILFWADLDTPQAIASGNVVQFSTGSLDFTLD